ncbi:MAG: secretin N-terminal domain-containing protein [Phycisphaerales bacterium JB037]
MERRHTGVVRAAVSVALAAGLPVSVAWAQPSPAEEPAKLTDPSTGGEAPSIRFNFKDAPFDEVLDFFSRESELPIIREAAVPKASMTFLSGEALTFEEALSVLNLNLRMHGVQLRKEDNYLYLATLADSFRRPSPVANGEVPEDATPDKILTVTIPLSNATATLVAEQIKPLISDLGGVTAVPAQNMVIVVETAAQIRRISDIIRTIDAEKPVDSKFQLFPLKHAEPNAVVSALTGLIGERQRTVVIDKDGKQRVVEEMNVGGVNLQPDPRTNSVIAVGPQSRIDTVAELIALLDVPEEGQGERQMVTLTLESITPQSAAQSLNQLFQGLRADRRPTILPLPEAGKITIVGSAPLLVQASALISELDPGAGGDAQPPRTEKVARLLSFEHLDPGTAEQVASRMLSDRQRQVLRYSPSPSGNGLLVSGPAGDVAALETLLRGLDVEPEYRADVRLVRMEEPNAGVVVDRARQLFEASKPRNEPELQVTLDEASGMLTLIGERSALSRFEQVLRTVQTNRPAELETRVYAIQTRRPSELVTKLNRLARPLLDPGDGSRFEMPRFEALDELDQLIVRAEPAQLSMIESLIGELDVTEPGDQEFRVVRVGQGDLAAVQARALELYERQASLRPEGELGELSVEADAESGSLLVSGTREAVRLYDESIRQAQQLLPPKRTTVVIDIQNVDAKEILTPLEELLSTADPIDEARRVPDPSIAVMERTNSLLVTAESAQHRLIADFVRRLDRLEQTELPPLKLLQLRAADSVAIASMLQQQYNKRPQADRTARPVEVRADPATNTLIVSAHAELFDEIKSFVEELNKEQREGPERVTVLFSLQVAKATDVAQAMDRLYPEPPMPRDRRGTPMPWLQKEKEVTVSADPSTNSLIIDAPADRIESLEELAAKLDRVEIPPVAELRTYQVVGADLQAVARTLQALSRNGNLAAPAQPGKKQVEVMVETEPRSSTLIVAGDEVTFERVEAVLADLSAVPVEKDLRIIPIANAEASSFGDRATQIYDAQIAQIPGANPVEVSIDEETNSLEIVADREAMERFMRIVDQLQEQAGPQRQVRLVELRIAKAADAVQFLNELVSSSQTFRADSGPQPAFEAIESTNTVMIAATPLQIPIVEQLLRNLDQSQVAETAPLRILRLRSTDAVELARVLQQSYDRRPVDEKAARPVTIQGDPATNTLIVSAHPEMLGEIDQLVTEMNESQAFDAEGREIAIFPLKIARAEELAKTIDTMFPEPPMPYDPRTRQPRPDLRQPKEIVVRADRATNSLIVDAPAKRLAGFEQLVRSLDQRQLGEDVELRTYRVEQADLNAVQRTLDELAQSNALGATGQTPVSIEVEPVSRTLVVSGPLTIFPQVEKVLEQFEEQPDSPQTTMRLYTLQHARADRLEALLSQLLVTRLREEQRSTGAATREIEGLLDVAADRASNTLIISAPESIQQIAEQLIRSLDVEAASMGSAVIRVVPLTYADAGSVSQTITRVLPTLDLPSGGEVLVVPAAGSNAILLSGAEADLAKVEELISPLDQRPTDENTIAVETFELEHASATAIAQTVQRLLADQLQSDPRILAAQIRYFRGQVPQRVTVRVEADERTNALVVSGPASSLELAAEVIQRLDEPDADGNRIIRTFAPARAQADTLAAEATRLFASRYRNARQRPEIVSQPRAGVVFVVGSEAVVADAVVLLEEIDGRSPVLPALDLTLVSLEHTEAQTVARVVEGMLRDRSRWPAELRDAERAGLSIPLPTVTADARSNRLLVSAPTSLLPMARAIIEGLDSPDDDGGMTVSVHRLERGDATAVAAALRDALRSAAGPGEPTPTVSFEARSNAVLVSGTEAQQDEARRLIGEMDVSLDVDGLAVRTLYLDHARAEAVAPLVEQLLTRQSEIDLIPDWARWTYIQTRQRQGGDSAVEQPVRVVAEPRLNALIVSAPAGVLELAEQVVSEIDREREGAETDRLVRVIPAMNADARELAATIEAVFADEIEAGPSPVVRVDQRSNALIVKASAAQLQRIGDLVEQVDRAALVSSRELRMVRVDPSRADATAVAMTLKQLLERGGGVKVEVISAEELLKREDGSRGPSGSRVEPDEEDARPFVRVPDEPQPPGRANLTGRALIDTVLGAAIASQPGEPPAAGDAPGGEPEQPTLTIAIDPETNSLIVVGSTRLTDRVAQLAAEIERQMPPEPTAVRVVRLPDGADAGPIANLLRATIGQVGRASADNPGGFTGRVAVSPDPLGGSLVVWANDTDFKVMGSLIASLATEEAAPERMVKVYALENMDAGRATRAVADFISPRPSGRQAQRIRALDLALEQGPEGPVRAKVDPATVSVTADPSGTRLIVSAPAESMELIDAFISLIDQSPVGDRLAIRRYELENARADDLSRTLQQLFDAQRQGAVAGDLPRARFVPDDRTNSLLVTASSEQHAEIERLLDAADIELADDELETMIFTLQQAQPTTVQRVLEQIVIGRDPAKRERVQISAENNSSILVVRAPAEDAEQVRRIVDEVDKAETTGLPIRVIQLQQADAMAAARSLSQFFQARAQVSSGPGRRVTNRVAVIGDRESGTLIVAASDEDFAQIEELAAAFDERAESAELQIKVIQLKNSQAADLQTTLENIQDQLWTERVWGNRAQDERQDRLYVQVNQRTNSIVLLGQGSTMETMERIVEKLDAEPPAQAKRTVAAVTLDRADPRSIQRVIQQSFATPGWRSWWGADPAAILVEIDPARRMVMLIGSRSQIDDARAFIEELDQAGDASGATVRTITLRHAEANRAADSINRFIRDRARAEGRQPEPIAVIGSSEGNVLIVSASAADLPLIEELVAQIDQPELGDDRAIEVYALQNASPDETARTLRSMFPATRADDRVIVTPQVSNRSLIISAPSAQFEQIEVLLSELDKPLTTDDVTFVTVGLEAARAADVAAALQSSLPDNVNVRITTVDRSNSLLLTGSPESIELVVQQIERLDTEPVRSLQQFKRIRLEHAMVDDVWLTLTEILRSRRSSPSEPRATIDYSLTDNTLSISATADQLEFIEQMVKELDQPSSTERTTEFVRLENADAEQTATALQVFYGRLAPEASTPGARRVTIVPDPASNSLVISADKAEWSGIRSLLEKLDTPEYDTSRQLVVIPLKHADAASVARALTEGFQASLDRQLERERVRLEQERRSQGGRNPNSFFEPPVLVQTDETPNVSAEVQTNSLIVFASRRDLERIRAIVEQLDVPEVLKLPEARIIPLESGRATDVARVIREMFRTGQAGTGSPRGAVVYGDDASNTLIVRAEDDQFEQISALARSLQVHASDARVSPRVLRVSSQPAARLRDTLLRTFQPIAAQERESLAIEIDRQQNALIVASSERMFREIESLVAELDGGADQPGGEELPTPGPGQGLFIIDVENHSPQQMQGLLVNLGVTRPQAADRPGLVAEPVTIVPLSTRPALAVLASSADGRAMERLIEALDAEPTGDAQRVDVVFLRLADARAVVTSLNQMLDTASQSTRSGPAQALSEQIRRLAIANPAWDRDDIEVDLTEPIRLIPDTQSNAVTIASTPGNVAALKDVVSMLDTLPVGDAVVVRIFPLENASARRVQQVVEDLFRQGETLRRLPGTQRRGLPSTATGQALAGEIAVSIDERTNALIVAGREEAVALVEVLVADLDDDATASWVEPTIVPLEHADPVKLSTTLRRVLVEGLGGAPEASGLQRQVARLRIVQAGGDASDPKARVEGDLFAPMTGLVILPEENLGALLVVGSTKNVAVVRELVGMLDVPAAAAGNEVIVYPLTYAAADRVAGIIRDIFREREAVGEIRAEDRLIVSTDLRTNALIVSTSPRSAAILETLLETLDAEQTNLSVGVRVITVDDADVQTLAPKIQRLMRERIAASRRAGIPESPSDAFVIEPEPATNSLIVAASEENFQVVEELIAALTESAAATGDDRSELVYVPAGQAEEIAQAIGDLYVRRENERRGDGSVAVVPNERLGALIVTGNDSDIEEIRALVESLATAEVRTEQDITRIELTSANSLEVVNLLESILAGRPIGGGRVGGTHATRVRFFRSRVAEELESELGREPAEAEVDGAIRDQVRLTADLRTNSVLVAAPPAMMSLIREIISDLDQTSAGDRTVEIFRLVNADARAMRELLIDLFQRSEDDYVLIPTRRPTEEEAGQDDALAQAFGGTSLTQVPDERRQLSITIDARTNSLIVSGTKEQLELVGRVVAQLDTIEATERDRVVYHLRNAQAEDVERTLRDYFQEEAERSRETLRSDQLGSLARQLEQEVTIVGDAKSNKLVISASPRYIDTVTQIVEELDAAPPQVVIQVLLAEVTVDGSDTWGVDVEVGPFGGDDYRVGSFPAGAAIATAIGVPNLSVASGDFNVLVRALEANGRLEVLSKPVVTVNNNEAAVIQVGENIAIVESVDTFESGRSQANVTRRDVGIILEVTPTISADGFVRMDIAPEISAVSARTTQISQDFEAPIITQRVVDTTVTVRDGQTVVIGGLIQTREEERRSKVPLLGDIPGIGEVFRTKATDNVKTELLVILTPQIIGGRDQAEITKQAKRSWNLIDGMSAGNRVRRMLGHQPLPLLDPGPEPERTPAPVDTGEPLGSSSADLPIGPAVVDVTEERERAGRDRRDRSEEPAAGSSEDGPAADGSRQDGSPSEQSSTSGRSGSWWNGGRSGG